MIRRNPESRDPSLVAGVPEALLLRLLAEREMDGYELARAIRVVSSEALDAGEGILYPALHALEARRLLSSRPLQYGGRARVCYRVSPRGARRLAVLQATAPPLAQAGGKQAQTTR
jgi:PadR family transcriptional regulator PadR